MSITCFPGIERCSEEASVQVDEIARRHGLSSVDPQVYRLLSRALDAHFSTVIKQVFTMARQRTDADRRRPGMVMSNNLRKKLHDINMKEEAARKQKEAAKQQTADEATEKVILCKFIIPFLWHHDISWTMNTV